MNSSSKQGWKRSTYSKLELALFNISWFTSFNPNQTTQEKNHYWQGNIQVARI